MVHRAERCCGARIAEGAEKAAAAVGDPRKIRAEDLAADEPGREPRLKRPSCCNVDCPSPCLQAARTISILSRTTSDGSCGCRAVRRTHRFSSKGNLMSNKLDFSKERIGRRALVTGGTRGMGAAIAQRLLDAGAKVVVTGRSRGEATPEGATFIAGDVSSMEGVKAIAAKAVGALGGLDILVNTAGGARPFAEGTASIPEEEWQASFGLNLFAAVRLTNAVLPALRESKVGAIVNISSNAARKAFSDATGAPADVFAQSVPLGRLGSPDDVAEVVALLVSDRGKWMTGANVLVDGGMTAR